MVRLPGHRLAKPNSMPPLLFPVATDDNLRRGCLNATAPECVYSLFVVRHGSPCRTQKREFIVFLK